MGKYSISIYRYNPSTDSEPTYDTYVLEFHHQPTILEVLKKIREEYDSGIAFRESCGLGKCGSCAVNMNGNPVLACRTPIEEVALIEPLKSHKIIKDLVVERDEYKDKLQDLRAFHNRPDYIKIENKPFQWDSKFSDLSQCIGCLICESACPAFNYNNSEFPGPASLAQLSRLLNHPTDLGNHEHVAWVDGIHNCTACMTCEHVCPKDVKPFRNGILELRSTIAEKQLKLPMMQQGLADQYKTTGSVVPTKQKKIDHPVVDNCSKTAVFLGCMFSDRYPEEGKKILNLLMSMGMKVQMPDGLVCCGGPLLWVGDRKSAEESFETNIKAIMDAKIEKVIIPCPGCGLTMKKDYNEYFRAKTGSDLPFKVIDMTEFIDEGYDKLDLENKPVKVVYHSPCHHGKGQDLTEKALEILKNTPGIDFIESEATNMCCGGMTSTSNPSVALNLSTKIIEEAEKAEANILVTDCVFCRDNLSRSARRKRSSVKIEHLLLFIEKLKKNN